MEPTDRIDIDHFDNWLDHLARGIASPVPDDAADLADTALWFHEKGHQTMLSPDFAFRLQERMQPALPNGITTAAPPPIGFRPRARPAIRETPTLSNRLLMATAAALLIAVPVVLLLFRSFGGAPSDPTIPAPMSGFTQADTPVACSVEQPTTLTISGTPEHEAVLFANTNAPYPNLPGAGGPALYREDLPTGPPVDSDELPGIQSMLDTLAACLYTQDYVSLDALFSDDSFRRSGANRSGDAQATPGPTNNGSGTPGNPLRSLSEPVQPIIISHNVLSDGRIGVLLAEDLTGFGLEQYFILVHSDRGWLVDEAIYVTSRIRATPEPSMVIFKITAIDLQFQPSRIEIPADADVTLVVTNVGQARKTFVIPELGIDEELPAGQTISIVVNAPKGVYEFYSDVPGQRAAGMQGLIIVLP